MNGKNTADRISRQRSTKDQYHVFLHNYATNIFQPQTNGSVQYGVS